MLLEQGFRILIQLKSLEAKKVKLQHGPYHPAFRQLVECSIWYDKVEDKISKFKNNAKKIEICANKKDVYNIIDHKKENILNFKNNYNIDVKVITDKNIKNGKFKINILETYI